MKLKNLFEQDLNSPIVKISQEDFDQLFPSGKPNDSGACARVFHNTDNTITKVIEMDQQIDSGIVKFVKMSMNSDNPFLPKIYKAQIYLVNSLGYRMVVVCEKLHKLEDIDEEVLYQIFDSLNVDLKNLNKSIYGNSLRLLFQDKRARSYIIKNSNNEYFKQALQILDPLFRKYGSDATRNNWMIRMTSYGPQLVINDPILPIWCAGFANQNKLVVSYLRRFHVLNTQFEHIKVGNVPLVDAVLNASDQIYNYSRYLYGQELKNGYQKAPENLKKLIIDIVKNGYPAANNIKQLLDKFREDNRFDEVIEDFDPPIFRYRFPAGVIVNFHTALTQLGLI